VRVATKIIRRIWLRPFILFQVKYRIVPFVHLIASTIVVTNAPENRIRLIFSRAGSTFFAVPSNASGRSARQKKGRSACHSHHKTAREEVRNLIAVGKERGYLLSDEVDSIMPPGDIRRRKPRITSHLSRALQFTRTSRRQRPPRRYRTLSRPDCPPTRMTVILT